jgi:hypothetical protein
MPDNTCEELNCCPPGFTVPPLSGTLALAGDDSTATDPNIVDGELVLAEEAELVISGIPALSSATLNAFTTPPIPPIGSVNFSNVSVGYFAFGVSISTTFTATYNSPNITVASNATAIAIGQIVELVTDYFPYGTVVLNVVGSVVTLSQNSLGSTPASPPTIISFRPTSGPLKIGANPLITSGTKVASIAGNFLSLTLDAPTLAPAALTGLTVAFFPAELDPNVQDEDELFT